MEFFLIFSAMAMIIGITYILFRDNHLPEPNTYGKWIAEARLTEKAGGTPVSFFKETYLTEEDAERAAFLIAKGQKKFLKVINEIGRYEVTWLVYNIEDYADYGCPVIHTV
jgi:hypothetical protein